MSERTVDIIEGFEMSDDEIDEIVDNAEDNIMKAIDEEIIKACTGLKVSPQFLARVCDCETHEPIEVSKLQQQLPKVVESVKKQIIPRIRERIVKTIITTYGGSKDV